MLRFVIVAKVNLVNWRLSSRSILHVYSAACLAVAATAGMLLIFVFLQKMNEFVFNSLWGWWYLILIWHHFWQCDLIFIWIHYIYDLSQHCVTSALIDIFQMPLARYIAYNIPTNQPILKRINHSMKRPGIRWYLSRRAFAGRARIKFTLQVIISGMSMIHQTFCITTKNRKSTTGV